MVNQYCVCRQDSIRLIRTIVCLVTQILTKNTSWKCMKTSTNVKNRGYYNFLMELLFIWNTHPQGLHVSYLIKRLLPLKSTQFINSPLELINFTLFGMWTCHNGFMVPKSYVLHRVPNWFMWSFWFGLNASQFRWMIFGRSYSFRFDIFGNVL
jgi:hypothetical protein